MHICLLREEANIAAELPYLVHFHLNLHVNLKLPCQIDPGFLLNKCWYQPAQYRAGKMNIFPLMAEVLAAAHPHQTVYTDLRTHRRLRQCRP